MASVKGADFVDMTLKYATSPLHPGAIKYFKEVGANIPDRLIGIIMQSHGGHCSHRCETDRRIYFSRAVLPGWRTETYLQ